MYGVQLDPAGFIFWANFGTLSSDPSPEAASADSITQQIQLTTHYWDYQDLKGWLRMHSYRLQPHPVGEHTSFPGSHSPEQPRSPQPGEHALIFQRYLCYPDKRPGGDGDRRPGSKQLEICSSLLSSVLSLMAGLNL